MYNIKNKTQKDEHKADLRRKKQILALKSEIERTRRDIEAAEMNFERVYKPSEVDIYIYELRKVQTKYDSLLSRLKELY